MTLTGVRTVERQGAQGFKRRAADGGFCDQFFFADAIYRQGEQEECLPAVAEYVFGRA